MARKAASKSVVKKTAGTDIATIDEQLAKEAQELSTQLGQTGGGNKIKIDRGRFYLPDGTDLGEEIQIVVVDFNTRRFYYTQPYNENNIVPPDCYAMGRQPEAMKPEDDSPMRQNDVCLTCPQNQWGSDGKGKACKERRWLAVLLVDPENPGAHNEPDAPIYLLDVSPSNLKFFDGAAKGVNRSLNGPPIKAILTVIGNDKGKYTELSFVDPMPNPHYAAHVARRPECTDTLERRPDFSSANAAPPPRARGNARRAATARR